MVGRVSRRFLPQTGNKIVTIKANHYEAVTGIHQIKLISGSAFPTKFDRRLRSRRERTKLIKSVTCPSQLT